MKAKPKRESLQAAKSLQAAQPLIPISYWTSAAIGITAYVFEESEVTIRQSGLVPEWVSYPAESAGNGIAVPAHHVFPSYLKLLRLESGRLRLIIDVRAVLREDMNFQCFLGGLIADTNLTLVKKESA
ncbi:hypothetical protein SAMN05216428_10155 [Nitrosospira sp. Nsp11]|uniref:hypothetical protein n=1 Tax=unclassified Nitrosospira TaxID=2609267 RepID=UPI00088948AA|nr:MULTISPECIES: hypothetical protein [unclassified Nitrosospira]SDA09903.1 hypothetical protein SAMN05216315_101137 [Nitrosospira sp. Nsp18]SHL09507.1 hypothetical protein SAMN05216428_10155 [Nitrosospira sp. Nsp11]